MYIARLIGPHEQYMVNITLGDVGSFWFKIFPEI